MFCARKISPLLPLLALATQAGPDLKTGIELAILVISKRSLFAGYIFWQNSHAERKTFAGKRIKQPPKLDTTRFSSKNEENNC